MTDLAGHIRTRFSDFKRHRDNQSAGWSFRLLDALRAFAGQYDPQKLADIRRLGGSEIYARLIAAKCRGASSMLRDVYLGADRPWGLDAPSDPKIPPEIMQSIQTIIQSDQQQAVQAHQQMVAMYPAAAQQAAQQGQPAPPPPPPLDPNELARALRDRATNLLEQARMKAKVKAADQSEVAFDKIDQILVDGKFYDALSEFLTDLPLFPFACIKGPYVEMVPSVDYSTGKPVSVEKPKLKWKRISPFDIWWTPGVARIEDAEMIERSRLTRANLNQLLDLPGYNTEAVRSVLRDYANGIADDWDTTDSERAVLENRENPQWNTSHLIACLEFNGNIQGKMLLDYGMSPDLIPDEDRDYFVQAWLIGQYVIKVQLSPSPRRRHPYFITSFEKVPGTPVGNGIPDIISDVQEAANATLRALVNNMSLSSGPQVVVNLDRIADNENADEIYPFKRWHVLRDQMTNSSGSEKPVDFFQPQSNVAELMQLYQAWTSLADDLSGIPKYLTGQGAGGAGRTASGLAMLIGNSSKLLQTVAANVDGDVMSPLLQALFDMILLTDDSGLLTGEEEIQVMGVNVALQRETQRSRQLEFLQITGNPMDMNIIGPDGRAAVLRAVAKTLGMPDGEIVPDSDTLAQRQQQQQAAAAQQQQAAAQAQGNQPPKGGNATGDIGPRTNVASTNIQGGAH